MGKTKKGRRNNGPPKKKDERTLPFLQDMFHDVEKDIVEIIFEQNEFDEEKTIQQLEELSLNDVPKPTLYDEEDFLDKGDDGGGGGPSYQTSDANDILDNFIYRERRHDNILDTMPSANVTYRNASFTSNNAYTSSISNYSNYRNYSSNSNSNNNISTNNTINKPFISSFEVESAYSINTLSTTALPAALPAASASTSSNAATTTTSSEHASSGDSRLFLSNMFPELDPTMVDLLYEENNNDVGKTVESLLSIVFMNHNGEGEDAEEAEDAESAEDVEEGDESETEEQQEDADRMKSISGVEESKEITEAEWEVVEVEQVSYDSESFKFDVPEPTTDFANGIPTSTVSDFIAKLNLLAELFPATPRTLLALELDEHDCDIKKTIESCCRADPEYLKKLSGDKTSSLPTKEERPKIPAEVKSVLKPNWVGAGARTSHNPKMQVKYVKRVVRELPKTTPKTIPSTQITKHHRKQPLRQQQTPPSPPAQLDLAAKLKLQQLKDKFSFVDEDILEAVFAQSGHKVHATLVCLYDIYPHLRGDASHAPSHQLPSRSSPPELPLTRKREKPTSESVQVPQAEKPKKKRTKPAQVSSGDDGDDGDESTFTTVSYRKKKKEASASAVGGATNGTPKKVMDSDDIENAYQNYREQAIKNGEMRNLLFMQAAAAYQTGDGAKAKALSQRGREYDEMMKEAHKQACHQIFVDCNARLDTLASIDLHGLHVAEALHVIGQLLEIHSLMGETTKKPKHLRVITGQGKHSLHGVAKIKPAVKNFLRSKGFSYAEAEAGVITIALSKY